MRILVFDIGGTSIKYGISEDHAIKNTCEIPTQAQKGGPHILHTLKACIEKESGFDAIGISTAGQVNSNTGTVIYANSNIPDYSGMQLRNELHASFRVPVMVENDVNCAAMGEAVFGAGKDFDSFLCLTYGTGVGGSIVENKSIYHGSSFSAGEFGGIVIHGTKKPDRGDVFNGCYERYASTTALVQSVMSYDSSLKNGRNIFEHIADKAVKQMIDEWIGEIILGLATIIHIFNPSAIVLGGGIMVQPYIIQEINNRIPMAIMPSFSHVKILQAQLGNSAGLYGISYLTQQYMK